MYHFAGRAIEQILDCLRGNLLPMLAGLVSGHWSPAGVSLLPVDLTLWWEVLTRALTRHIIAAKPFHYSW